jgi:hypothetical protein
MKVAGSSLICFHYSQMAQKRNEQKGTQKKKSSKKSWRMTSSKIMSPWTAMARQKEGRKVTNTTVRRGSRCRNYSATTVPLSDHLITAAVVESISVPHGVCHPKTARVSSIGRCTVVARAAVPATPGSDECRVKCSWCLCCSVDYSRVPRPAPGQGIGKSGSDEV